MCGNGEAYKNDLSIWQRGWQQGKCYGVRMNDTHFLRLLQLPDTS
jgi:hypothetical protein